MEYQKPIKVILVDDEPDILDFLGYHLVKAGYETHTASNGKDAIKKAIRLSPDLVVLDIMMPECDGIRVCHRLKHCRRTNNSLVMFLTAGSSRFAQNALELAHADDYLLKPVPPSQFMMQ
ncbi:MAG: response regulator [Saprospiraceae bacterium]